MGEGVHSDIAREAEAKGLEAWKQFKVSSPVKVGIQSKEIVGARWVLTWRAFDGVETANARVILMGNRHVNIARSMAISVDLRNGEVDIEGCATRRSSHWQLMSRGAWRGGRFRVWMPRMPFSRRIASTMRFISALDASGLARMVAGFGDWGRQRIVLMAPQLRVVGPCAGIR